MPKRNKPPMQNRSMLMHKKQRHHSKDAIKRAATYLKPSSLLRALSLAPLPGAELGPISIVLISALSTAISSRGILAGMGGGRDCASTWYALLLAAALA